MWSIGQRINIEFLENQEFIVVKHMEGGMGDVYKVVDPSYVRSFSIKTIKQRMSASDFKNECRNFVTASLHKSCVKPVGYGLIDSNPAIAYHWYASTLEDHNSMNWKIGEIENLLLNLMEFFHYACSEIKILHCDIKPSNILLDENKNPYVTDFGISKNINKEESLNELYSAAGTREYMAPELLFTKRQNVKSELYSFGLTMYKFLTGEHPYLNELDPEKNARKLLKDFKLLNKRLGRSMADYLNYIESCISIESINRPDSFKLVEFPKIQKLPKNEKSDRTLIDSIIMQASYYRKENDFVKSEQILNDAIDHHGRHPVLLNGLGNTYSCSRSRQEAIKPLEEASELIFRSDGILDYLLYLDPIMNLSMQYRCVGRHNDAYTVLNRAWNIFSKHINPPLLYAEFGWMMTYEGNFLGACSYMNECFINRSIQPFEMLFFTEAAWISGKIEKYADKILSNVVYNHQFDCSYFLCAFLLSKYSSDQAVARLMTMVDQKSLLEIEHLEYDFQLSTFGLRPPQDESVEASVMLGIDHAVTRGKHHNHILDNSQ
jgi:serine/threonine protein kinase